MEIEAAFTFKERNKTFFFQNETAWMKWFDELYLENTLLDDKILLTL